MMNPAKASILLVEDEENLLEALKLNLELEGYEVTCANNGALALKKVEEEYYDLILLDVMLPEVDGFDVCETIRLNNIDTPILMLSARSGSADRVAGLKRGADDYLTKPFAPKELSARIRALLRRVRPSAPGHSKLVFGNLEIIPDEGKVTLGGKDVPLTKTEFRLLCELAHDPNGVFSREVLLDKVWGHGYFGDGRLVDVHIRRLRMKVEVDPAEPTHVVTVRGLGYRLQS